MKKITLLGLLFFVVFFSRAQTFTVEQEITGNVKINVNAIDFSALEIKYWDVTLSESTATIISPGLSNLVRIKINPFKSWNFRIKVGFGGEGEWSQIETLDNSCVNVPNYVGFTENFSSNPILNCWRGYFVDSNQDTYDYIIYSTGNFIQLASQNGSKVIVSPRFEDLSTDKKITFKLRGNYIGTAFSIKVGTIENPYDETTFHELGSYSVNSNQFELKTLFLNNYNGIDKHIAFKYSNGSIRFFSIDDFSYLQSVNCFDANNISFSDITTNSAVINFDSNGQTNWEMKLKNTITNFELSIPLTSGDFTIPNLNPGTTYEVKLRANCDVGLYSNWSPVTTFTTGCQELNVGYYSGFDTTSYIDPCWKKIVGNSNELTINNNSDASSLPNYISLKGSNSSNTIFVSPFVNDFTNKRVRFKLFDNKRAEFLKFSLIVGVLSDPADASTFIPLKTFTHEEINPIGIYELGSFWQQFIVDFLSVIPSNYHYIGFKISNAPTTSFSEQSIAFDDFYFEDIPICKEPTNIQIVNYDYDNVTISWEDTGLPTPSQWQIEYGISGFTLGTGQIITASSSTHTINNLLSNTNYDFYIKSICDSDNSNYSSKRTCKTRCEGVNAGYSTSFEDGSSATYLNCWRRLTPIARNYTYSPNYYNFVVTSTSSAHTGSKYVMMRSNSPIDPETVNKNTFVTPRLIDFDNSKMVKFWTYCYSNSSQNPQKIIVGTLSDPDDYTTFTPFEVISYPLSTPTQWKQFTVDFSSYSGTDKYIGFKNHPSTNSSFLIIDDFEYLQNSCNKPTGLRAFQSAQNSVTLTWNSNIEGSSNYQIEYGIFGFTPGDGTILNVTGNTFTINNLTLLSKYQFRVRNICSNNHINWSDLLPFKISCTVNAPFYENFDQYQSVAGFPYLDPNLCWSSLHAINASIYQYYLNNVNSPPNVAFVESNSAGEGVFVSPYLVDFDNTKIVKFWTRLQVLSSSQNLSIIVGTIENPMDLSTFTPFQSFPLSETYQAGQEFIVNFSSYTGNHKHIAFKTFGYNETGYITNRIFIDDVYYYVSPDCFEPIDVNFSQTNHESTLLSWINVGSVQSTKIEYGLTGFTPGSGIELIMDSNQTLITGLNSTSDYDFYLNSICSDNISTVIGPFTVRTTCVPNTIPWFETFDNLTQYGQNLLPPCFKLPGTNTISSRNVPITLIGDWFSPDHVLTGYDDSFYLNAETNTSMYTPMFHLEQGTSYKFSLQARKRYEYDFSNIRISAYRGQETYAHISDLSTPSFLSEYEYNQGDYFYTPIETGDYSFLLYYNDSGGLEIISDDFSLDEGYPNVVDSNRLFNFDQGIDNGLIVEKTQNTNISLQNINNNNALKFTGSTNGNDFVSSENIWADNQNSISKVNFKIAAENFETLYLSFKLKQTYAEESTNSGFRVVLNGNILGDIIYPISATQDLFQAYEFDLSSYLGSDLKISLQHIGKTTLDNAFLDDISVNENSSLNVNLNYFNSLKVFPNPTSNFVTIECDEDLNYIAVYNLRGQMLYEIKGVINQTTVDLSNYTSGIYFFKIKSENSSKTIKILKE